ncbi:hypothetical protein DPMN_055929 [Dreissena polymorpha]|uniref:Uncharacterized protein n=1 Tax=Dreissena polymorpha TaxID=45954 RepID=A0A9D4CTJ1_DREPO|nr:hypothetical protein DPMN_055929 [Dreissena polymorpha]
MPRPLEAIFELIQYIIETNILIKFHEVRKINVASRVLTRKNTPPPGGHTFQPTCIIFEPVQDIIGMNLLTKFHEDWTINVASRVLTRKKATSPDIIRTNLLTKFHEDRKINVASRLLTRKNAPPPNGRFHEDRTISVASRVKNATPLGSYVFTSKHIIETNLLTKFHEDCKINVASRVLTRQMLTPHNARRTKGRSQKHTMSTLCSDLLETHTFALCPNDGICIY